MNENFNKFQLENNGLKKNTIDHILSGKYPEGGGGDQSRRTYTNALQIIR